jgi:CDP-glucose 4,6-dehydratase
MGKAGPRESLRSFAGERVLVTGHTGFKGAWLCSWLLADGVETAGPALAPETGRPSLFADLGLERRMGSTIGDIRDFGVVRAVFEDFRPTVVFHLAAQALVRRGYADPLETFGSNVMGTAHVLEAARSCDSVRALVCVTTDKVYENREWFWAYREIDPLGGKDPYSASKAAAEMVAGAYIQTLMPEGRLKMATARGGNVIGGGDWSQDRLVPDIIRAAAAGQPLILRNPGAVRPWQHVLELVRGYLVLAGRLLDGDASAVGAWNFGPNPENEVEVGTLVEALRERWGPEAPEVRVEPSPLKEATYLKLDIAKAAAGLNWRPMLGVADTLALTADWYRAYEADPSQARAQVDGQIAAYRARL